MGKIILWSCVIATLLSFAQLGFSQSSLQWRTLSNAPSAQRMDDIFFLSPYRGWIVANGAVGDLGYPFYGNSVWRTTDGGENWQYLITLTPYLRSIGFVDSLKGWLGTVSSPDSVLYQTTDGGESWSLVTNITGLKPHGICGISVVNDSVIYGSGQYYGPPRVIKTTDRGASWKSKDLSTYAGALVDCYFFSPDSGFVVGSSNGDYSNGYTRILFTSDGGNSWTTRHSGDRLGELCWKIHFINRSVGYVSIEKFTDGPTHYLKTTDGGLTWTDQLFREDLFDVQGIGFVSEDMGWLGGWGGDSQETTDGGETWHKARVGYLVNRFRFIDQYLGYCSGETVYKYSFFSCTEISGDANGSGSTPNLSDILFLVNYLFKFTAPPTPTCRGDVDTDGIVDLSDVIYLVNYIFKGGPKPKKTETCCL